MYENFSAPSTKSLNSIFNRLQKIKTGRKITINGSDTAGYDKSKVECFNCHKMGHFTRECRGPRNQDSRNMNQDSSRRTINVEETSSKAMVAIDGAGFDWSYMANDEVPINMALMDFLDSEAHNDKTCLKSFETLKTQLDKLRIEFNKSEFNLATYKRGLASVEEQLVFYKKNEVIFCEQLAVLKRDISYKDSDPSMLKRSQIHDKSRNGLEFPEFEGYGPKTSKNVSEDTSNEVRESPDAPMVKKLVSDDKLEKKTVFSTVAKIEFVRPKQQEKPVRKPVKHTAITIKGKGWNLRIIIQGPKVVNTARPNLAVVNAMRVNQVNAVKASACWVWRPTKLNSASITLKKHNYVDIQGKSKSVMGTCPISHTSRNLIEDMLPLGEGLKEGIDYDEVFALVARIKAIGLFLAYASFKDFVVYQMDVKSAFLYGKIEKEVYVCQPLGFEDPEFPDRVYKQVHLWRLQSHYVEAEDVDVHLYRSMIGSYPQQEVVNFLEAD
ncbi:ribonuclease H-like domain-containing protein [Tanacetum coccineum]